MPAYKYTTSAGKKLWYSNFYYKDYNGKSVHKCKRGFATKKEAQDWERSFLEKSSKDPTITFSALLDNYLEDMRLRLKPTTMANKEAVYRSKIKPFFGEMKICDITPLTVRQWQNSLIEFRDEKGNAYSETYLKTLHVQLSCLMNYAVKYYNLSKNPCHSTGGIGNSNADEMKIWSREQFESFIRHEDIAEYHLAFNILFYTGMREGELLALTPDDIPRDEPVIHVSKTYAVVDGDAMLLTPKTPQSLRDIPIHQQLHDEIMEYIDSLFIKNDDLIFWFSKASLLKEFHSMAQKAGLEQIRIHDLRHSHVSMLIQMGIPLPEISKRLGHKSPSTTLRIYSHLIPGNERRIAVAIGRLIDSPENG